MPETEELTASEALFAFCGWLTTRYEKTVMSASDNAAPASERIKEFCDKYQLKEPRVGWDEKIKPMENA